MFQCSMHSVQTGAGRHQTLFCSGNWKAEQTMCCQHGHLGNGVETCVWGGEKKRIDKKEIQWK